MFCTLLPILSIFIYLTELIVPFTVHFGYPYIGVLVVVPLLVISGVAFLAPLVPPFSVGVVEVIGYIFHSPQMLASSFWFFPLAYGASKLTPFFNSSQTWRVLDFIIGIVMWSIAVNMISHIFSEIVPSLPLHTE